MALQKTHNGLVNADALHKACLQYELQNMALLSSECKQACYYQAVVSLKTARMTQYDKHTPAAFSRMTDTAYSYIPHAALTCATSQQLPDVMPSTAVT